MVQYLTEWFFKGKWKMCIILELLIGPHLGFKKSLRSIDTPILNENKWVQTPKYSADCMVRIMLTQIGLGPSLSTPLFSDGFW